ncbi:hypothetical protein MHY85_01545 [Cellulomonas sp. ACRRI]|uniref:hypothetical protein n=1 Tax=Cellulomonas sp. ACRRI TaxID=2918188 RepID=UPI001EF1B14F|nr:hypothetical protein [Cellulomonas sp. ACRRI]MCG7284654.1 hypothetical protein [Cellulomonas sp. ACRRI]
MRSFRSLIAVATCAGVLAISGQAAIADDDTDATVIDGIEVSVPGVETSADLEAFILSDESKTVTSNPSNGEIISVETGQSLVSPLTTSSNVCKTGNMCLFGTGVPNANYGFTGAGTMRGNWPARTKYTSGSWTAKVRFANGIVSPEVGPNSTNLFDRVTDVIAVSLR